MGKIKKIETNAVFDKDFDDDEDDALFDDAKDKASVSKAKSQSFRVPLGFRIFLLSLMPRVFRGIFQLLRSLRK